MKNQNKLIAASLTAAMILSSGASAASSRNADAVIVEMMGQRSWEVSCQFNQTDGDIINTREGGRGLNHNARVIVDDVTSGTCAYSVPENGELRVTLRVENTLFDCPFTMSADGFCRAQFVPGQTGSFRINRTPVPATTGS